MLLSIISLIVSSSSLIVTAAPQSIANNPSTTDPAPPTTSLKSLSKAENPYPTGIPTMPEGCDGGSPSEDCIRSLASDSVGGYLWFDPNGQCDMDKQVALQTAVWDATTLALYSSNFPQEPHGPGSGHFYIGPNYPHFASRISGNLKRVWQFKTPSTSTREYITISCKDTKNLCNKPQEGKAVGGYARTEWRWLGFGYYHYITLCDAFFSIRTLDEKVTEVEDDLRTGSQRKAGDMRYLKTTGQFFLHEMMHLRVADGGIEPHITDEYVGVPRGQRPGTNDRRAYGPALVHKLAQMRTVDGGGADIASTNADSYAMLANALWWWDMTGVFPGVPGPYYSTTSIDDDLDYPIMLHVDLGNSSNATASTDSLNSLYFADLATYPNAADEVAAARLNLTSTTNPSISSTNSSSSSSAVANPCGDMHAPDFGPDGCCDAGGGSKLCSRRI